MDVPTAPGLRPHALSQWLARLDGAPSPPFSFRLVTGGRTHLTYQVSGADGRSVALRRAPGDHPADAAADASDEREHRIVYALAAHGALVPRPLARCRDDTVTGAPFSVFEWIGGRTIGDAQAARLLHPLARATVGASFMQALAAVHRLDPQAAGLGDMVRSSSYADRQVRAWRGQAVAALGSLPLPQAAARQLSQDIGRLADVLIAEQPPTDNSALLHGDYRLENVIVSGRGQVRAIVDWELAAVGDPLADAAYAVLMWAPFDSLGRPPATSVPGFCSGDELLRTYEAASGRPADSQRFGFHLALAAWRAACIGAVVLARYQAGQVASVPVDSARAAAYLTRYRDICAESLGRYTASRVHGSRGSTG